MLKNPAKRLRTIYKLALLSIGLLVLVEQFMFKNTFEGQLAESRFINLSGNQRTLCQKLAKTGLLLATIDNVAGFTKRKSEFEKTYQLWVKNHDALQNGSTELDLPSGHNSKLVKELFERVAPHFKEIQKASIVLISAQHRYSAIKPNSKTIQRILQHEPDFTKLMDDITHQYEKEAKARAITLEITEIVLAVLTYAVLFLLGYFVFRPTVRAVDEFFNLVVKKNEELEGMNDDLKDREITLKQQTEELRATEEELRQNTEELVAINENLEHQNATVNRQAGRMDEMLKELTANRREIAKKNSNITSSIKYAFRIQDAILPKDKEILDVFPDSFLLFEPRDIVSGDFIWIYKNDFISMIVVADCTGHGIPGAFMSIIGNLLLNRIIKQSGILSPDVILNQLHEGVQQTLRQRETQLRDGMDVCMCVVNHKDRFMEFAGAKNGIYYLQKNENGEPEEFLIKGDKFPIGGKDHSDQPRMFSKHRIDITKKTTFYLYSDGYQDQFGGEGKGRKFMAKRFRRYLEELHTLTPHNQKAELLTTLRNWMGEDHHQLDDITIFGATV